MVNITFKSTTLRKAIAVALVNVSDAATVQAIEERRVPKGDIFEFARAAGLLAIKKTSDVIPDCHPLPIEFSAIRYRIEGLTIVIEVEVHTIYKTGVEVEAMHGASVVALTMYDMLKPIDKGVEIGTIRLHTKTGGKSDVKKHFEALRAAIVVSSDSVSRGEATDTSGAYLLERLQSYGISVAGVYVVPDEQATIESLLTNLVNQSYDLVVCSGGTGLSPRDVTPEAIRSIIDIEIPGIMETARAYGQQRIGFSMLSRSVAGFAGNTLIVAFPGSLNAVKEYSEALFPTIFHVFPIRKGEGH